MSLHIKICLGIVCCLTFLDTFCPIVRGLANCPSGCHCDDNTLVVQCGEGQLDVLPIALNPSIQRLVIRNNKIKTIDSSIQFYAELTFLDLSSNHLMTIPQQTFTYQKKLHELHLNNNEIAQISNKTFIGLSALLVLNLRHNFISELHQSTFAPLKNVSEINLGMNRINFIDPKAFDGLKQLRILHLDDNALISVPDRIIFQTLPSLAELYLGMNNLVTIPSSAFSDVKALTRLSLNGANLHNISLDSFLGLESLRILDLSDNRLLNIPSFGISNLSHLEELLLNQNDFEIILEGAFVGLKELKRLEISNSQRLKSVLSGAFAANTNLEYLNLSNNKVLFDIQEGALSGLVHLRQVVFKENALATLSEGLFPWKDLKLLDLSANPIVCDCRIVWLRNLLLAKNGSSDSVVDVICEYPDRLRGENLKNLNPTLMGCSHTDPHKQAVIGALLVGSAATITALALIIYRCRRKIREYLKGGMWGGATLGRKEREYIKTFCDEDYITRLQRHSCSLGIHSTFPHAYTPHHAIATSHYNFCDMTINDLSVDHNSQKNCFQQLQVPKATIINDSKSFQKVNENDSSIDNSSLFVMRSKTTNSSLKNKGMAHKLNHYTKSQFLTPTAIGDDSCYSYADIPIAQQHAREQQMRLTQDCFAQKTRQLYSSLTSDDNNDGSSTSITIIDPSYSYSNIHYSMPLEPTIAHSQTPTPPLVPPALPLRNGLSMSSVGHRSISVSDNQSNIKINDALNNSISQNTTCHFH